MRTFTRILLLSLPLLLLATSCYDDDDIADVRLYWTFDGMGCRASGVDRVEIVLEDVRGRHVYETGRIQCRAGWVELLDLEPGRYWISAEGFRYGERRPRWALRERVRLYEGFNEYTLDLGPY